MNKISLEKRQKVSRYLQSVLFSQKEFRECHFVAALWIKNVYMIITEDPIPIVFYSDWSAKLLDTSNLKGVSIQFYSAVEDEEEFIPTLELDYELYIGEEG
jgi:hypothetical protein